VHTDAVKAALVRSLVHFAAETGTELCAEGIESLDELATLAHLGVSLAQGFALARPAPPWTGVSEAAAEVCRRVPTSLRSVATPSDRLAGVAGPGRRR